MVLELQSLYRSADAALYQAKLAGRDHVTLELEPMRARIENMVVFLNHEDVPSFKKRRLYGTNSYFWALRSLRVKLSGS